MRSVRGAPGGGAGRSSSGGVYSRDTCVVEWHVATEENFWRIGKVVGTVFEEAEETAAAMAAEEREGGAGVGGCKGAVVGAMALAEVPGVVLEGVMEGGSKAMAAAAAAAIALF